MVDLSPITPHEMAAGSFVSIDADGADRAKSFARNLRTIIGTPVEEYYRSRGIDPSRIPKGTVGWASTGAGSGLMGVVGRDADGEIAYVQTLEFEGGKPVTERIKDKERKKRRNRGSQKGNPLTLPGDMGGVFIAEGSEDALSIWQATGKMTYGTFGTSALSAVPVPPGADITIVADNDENGRGQEEALKAAAHYTALGHRVCIAMPKGHKDVNDLLVAEGADAVLAMLGEAVEYSDYAEKSRESQESQGSRIEFPRSGGEKSRESQESQGFVIQNPHFPLEPPRPLRRPVEPPEDYPIEALGSILGNAATAIVDLVQCPSAIAGNSVLAAAALATQGHADVIHPATGPRPISLSIMTVAESGDRKSSADDIALAPVYTRESELRECYTAEMEQYAVEKAAYDKVYADTEKKAKGSRDEIARQLRDVGRPPSPPLNPMLTCDEPTIEGIHKHFSVAGPSQGLFNNEAGTFLASHGMSDEKQLRTLGGLSKLWDGAPIRRVRAGPGESMFAKGRRLSSHLMVQPLASQKLLGNKTAIDQGITSRLLVSCPISIAGTRFQREPSPGSQPALTRYSEAILRSLRMPLPVSQNDPGELVPRALEVLPAARREWVSFVDHVEAMLGSNGPLTPIKGFAGKVGENALRVAGVLTLADNPDAGTISAEAFDRARILCDHYATEALRLFEAGDCPPEIRGAEKLLEWLQTGWKEPYIGLRVIYRLGPNSIRDKAAAAKAVAILEDHGWLVRDHRAGIMVDGSPVREAWRIVREDV